MSESQERCRCSAQLDGPTSPCSETKRSASMPPNDGTYAGGMSQARLCSSLSTNQTILMCSVTSEPVVFTIYNMDRQYVWIGLFLDGVNIKKMCYHEQKGFYLPSPIDETKRDRHMVIRGVVPPQRGSNGHLSKPAANDCHWLQGRLRVI